jgi:23S rRNA pseudouridine2605 synthase
MDITGVRLQKYIADCGVASRRRGEELIKEGKVSVNGKIITELGVKVIPGRDIVAVEGKDIKPENKKVYILLNKPEGYITTADEQFGRPSVMDLIKDVKQRVFPVGRLDMDTSGLLILTNDGDFAYKLTHPKHNVRKKYIAEVKGIPDGSKLNKFRKGLTIDGTLTAHAEIRIVSSRGKFSILEIVIHEGRNRQVRKMCAEIGHPVVSLKRIEIGRLGINDLPEGKWRYLKKEELKLI